MSKFVITGGHRLQGVIKTSGAKNAALPILAASLLTDGKVNLCNVPELHDIKIMEEVLRYLGAIVDGNDGILSIDGEGVATKCISEDLMRKMRASNLLIGPLLARFGYVKAPYPGGCAIGSRPMDLHLKGLRALGASITEKHGFITAETTGLKGAEIHFDFPSVGATENLMMAATLAKGKTLLTNAAKEPEIIDLANFLNKMGAKISGAGTCIIKIEGVPELGGVYQHSIMPDRIEAGTYMVAAAMTSGDLLVEGAVPEHLEALTAKLKEAGVQVFEEETGLRVVANDLVNSIDVKTMPYPGYPTDLQPQIMALMTIANGTSIISESIFENRFKHVDEFRRMGAQIKTEGKVAIVKGVSRLSGSTVEATDLRAGAALVLAGLAAEGETIVENLNHIYRGYENLVGKLRSAGAQIKEITDS